MKVGFDAKYGHDEIEVPVEQYQKSTSNRGLKNKFTGKVTIYNDIPADGEKLRSFNRFVIEKCLIYSRLSEREDGTVSKAVNSREVITKDTAHYKPPAEYKRTEKSERENFYTVQVNDFVVLEETDDVVTTSQEWAALQKKYKDNGFSVTGANINIYGMNTDNVHIMNA